MNSRGLFQPRLFFVYGAFEDCVLRREHGYNDEKNINLYLGK